MIIRTRRRGISRGDPGERGPLAVNEEVAAAVVQLGGAAAEAGGDAEAETRLLEKLEETMIL